MEESIESVTENEINPKVKHADDMTFLEHLEELRWNLVRSSIAILFFTVLVFIAKRFVFDYIIFAPKHPDFLSYRMLCWMSENLNLGERLCFKPLPFEIINLEVTGQFLTHVKVSLILGFILAFPYFLYQMWLFVKPGLYDNEIRNTRGVVFFCTLLFNLGLSFGYFIIIPFSINFLVSYSVSGAVIDNINLGNYISYIAMISLASGIIFELPIAVYFLSKLGLITPDFMKNYRRHAFILILLSAAIITPPDITSQILITFPVYLLYELGIKISKRVYKNMELQNSRQGK